ncbi:PAS domain S-box protein [Pseudoxanthomonas composti]|uniref:protein-glutamate O-methyltransferase n=1 Tax=Pseudoxanthomonas composti TaxID=2137479 RepID=A0A4V1N0P0_9GAMM|nr:PAS domain S-box protein [Pseudoxanthomonas composti]
MTSPILPEHPPEGADMGLLLVVIASGKDLQQRVRDLSSIPADPRMCVVLVVHDHAEGDDSARLTALDQSGHHAQIPRDGARIVPGTWFLAPSQMVVSLEQDRFRLRLDQRTPGERGVIDTLLVSAAQAWGRFAACLMLGEIGDGDGALGVTTIKDFGGLTLATADPAQVASDPSPAESAALVDELLPAAAVGARLTAYLRHLFGNDAIAPESAVELQSLNQIATILRSATGHDFHGYKRATFLRRVQRRMQVVQASQLEAYLEILRSRPEEAQRLFNDLLIGVTQFFRDQKEFDFLQKVIVPRMFEGKTAQDQIRVWVLGCSTGEEAYSIGILLREFAETLDAPPHLQIFASDIDGRALAMARVGRYPLGIAADIAPERLARWFVKEADTYRVVRELREMCIFSQHSIVKDPPFSKLDLVSCRNLLIYLDADLQSRVVPLFHFALKPRGYLFLGNSENVSRHARLFSPVERSYRVFHKIAFEGKIHSDFPLAAALQAPPATQPALRPAVPSHGLVRLGERIAERHAPAYAVIDEQFDVLHFSSQVGRFIHPNSGTPSLNLLNLAHRDLRLDLRSALDKASLEQRPVRLSAAMAHGEVRTGVEIIVEPTADPQQSSRGYVVLFKELATAPTAPMPADEALATRDEHVRALEHELRVTRERLQAMIEELESTNEELKSSNEEYQSLNEELQSANEELETSKEELQSVNEEVTTVNGELGHRVQELAQANSDLKNLFESTQIATVFLDNELRVTNFTPAVTDILPLVEGDLHRPIAHLKCRLAYDELQDDVRRVIRTLASVEREVEDPATAERYIVRVLPYRSVDNFIGGAVVTFTDITQVVQAQRALRDSETRLRTLVEGIPQLVWRSLDQGSWTWSSPQWAAWTGQQPSESAGLGWLAAIHPEDRAATHAAWTAANELGVLEVEHRIGNRQRQAYRWFHTRGLPVRDERGNVSEWLGTSTDIDELRRPRP